MQADSERNSFTCAKVGVLPLLSVASRYCFHLTQEDGDDGALNGELISQAKQSRSEKKARKALCKLGKPPATRPLLTLI